MIEKNNMNQLKNVMIQEIELRVNFVIADNRSLIHSKIHQANEYPKHIYALGGGNFLATQGIFSALNLLSKINSIVNGANFEVKNNYFKIIKNGKELRETACFKELFNNTKDLINWGFNKQNDAGIFWDNYRNSLSHVTAPKDGVGAMDCKNFKGVDFDSYIISQKINGNFNIYDYNCINSNGQKIKCITIEFFNERLSDILNLIISKVKRCNKKITLNNIKKLLEN